MFVRSFFKAFFALLVSATLIGNAQAYPSTARSGVTTVTGLYSPLDLSLSLIDGTSALAYNNVTGAFTFNAKFSGNYTGVGYTGGGFAGDWQLLFGSNGSFPNIFPNVSASADGSSIILSAVSVGDVVATLTYLGGGDYATSGFAALHPLDTPLVGDFFNFQTVAAGAFLQVTCQDGIASCNVFDVAQTQSLKQLGPYVVGAGLDGTRVNTACGTADNYVPCGSARVSASSVPEPASLALVGLGLAGLAWVRRRQRQT